MYTVEIILFTTTSVWGGCLYVYRCMCLSRYTHMEGRDQAWYPLGACYFAFFLRQDPSLRLELTDQARSCPVSQRNPGALPPTWDYKCCHHPSMHAHNGTKLTSSCKAVYQLSHLLRPFFTNSELTFCFRFIH